MKVLLLLIPLALLLGCDGTGMKATDMCMQRKLFSECMQTLASTGQEIDQTGMYQCEQAALRMSTVDSAAIKGECR